MKTVLVVLAIILSGCASSPKLDALKTAYNDYIDDAEKQLEDAAENKRADIEAQLEQVKAQIDAARADLRK